MLILGEHSHVLLVFYGCNRLLNNLMSLCRWIFLSLVPDLAYPPTLPLSTPVEPPTLGIFPCSPIPELFLCFIYSQNKDKGVHHGGKNMVSEAREMKAGSAIFLFTLQLFDFEEVTKALSEFPYSHTCDNKTYLTRLLWELSNLNMHEDDGPL